MFHDIKSEKSIQGNSFFPSHCSYGFVELSKFCKFGVAQQGTDKRDYCAAIYYQEEDARRHRVYFTISWNTEFHSKVSSAVLNNIIYGTVSDTCILLQLVQEQIHNWQENAIKGHDQIVEFTENQIKLDIPFGPSQGGITSQNGEWRILSLSPPVVRV